MGHCSEILIADKKSEIMVEAQEFAWRNADHEECGGTISYQGYDDNPTNILGILKTVKTEKELIELIEESITTSNKCLLYLVVKERVE